MKFLYLCEIVDKTPQWKVCLVYNVAMKWQHWLLKPTFDYISLTCNVSDVPEGRWIVWHPVCGSFNTGSCGSCPVKVDLFSMKLILTLIKFNSLRAGHTCKKSTFTSLPFCLQQGANDCSNSSSELSVDVAVTANRNRVCAVDLTQLTSCNAHIQHRQVIFICAEIVTRGQ